ncbi:MAG: 4Fe-4S dicluster domain-containing protein [Candidatus Eisenbacteria bacterium]|nr:4Fe-4S dicluster domain-containing protein [Candidatus Eisenbacteria bacterium]
MTEQPARKDRPRGDPATEPLGARDASRPPLQIDFAKRRRLLESLGGNRASYCYQCGACVGDCPSARFYPEFNPREIMLTALLGDLDSLLAEDGIIWKCSNCYNCYERCPQDVRPVEVIVALKNLASRDGAAPESVRGTYEMIRRTGRSAPVLDSLNKRRERMGLPPLNAIDLEELDRLLEPAPKEEPSAGDAPTRNQE